MTSPLPAYRIKVRTTNGLNDTCCCRRVDKYFDVQNGEFYPVTDQIHKFMEWLGDELLEIQRVGVGYGSMEGLTA